MASNGKLRDIPMPLAIMVILVVICIAIFVGLYASNFGYFLSGKTEVWGQFGDYIGGILNPFIAFTALLGLSYTILLQRKQMKQAEEDFKAQSEVQKEQLRHAAEAFQSQKIAQEKQVFESTFFQLLTIFSEVARDVSIKGSIKDTHIISMGEVGVYSLLKELNLCRLVLERAYIRNYKVDIESYDSGHRIFYNKNEFVIGHYFRVLYNIIKFIDRSTLEFDEKKFYSNLVRSQLSNAEITLLFYNGISKNGREKFLPLIKKYSLLKNIENSESSIGSYEKFVDAFLNEHS